MPDKGVWGVVENIWQMNGITHFRHWLMSAVDGQNGSEEEWDMLRNEVMEAWTRAEALVGREEGMVVKTRTGKTGVTIIGCAWWSCISIVT